MTTLGAWLKTQGFTVDDNNVPYGRESTWKGVQFLMVHHTVSACTGSESSIASYCRTGGSGTYPPLCQIVLGNSGKVWMTCKERSGQKDPGRASHAGNGSGYGIAKDSMNQYALGIECQCDGKHKLATHQKQYTTLIRLLAVLSKRYNVPVSKIIGHKEWSTTGKVDPRDDMNKIRADVAAELKSTAGAPYVTKDVYRSKCGFGEPTNGDASSDTVKELQERLNRVKLTGGVTLTVNGKYDTATDTRVRLWQDQICNDTPDPAKRSFLGPEQFKVMFPGTSTYVRHDDGDAQIASAPPPVTPPEPPVVTPPPIIEVPPEPPVTVDPPKNLTFPLGIEYHYSGKPSANMTFAGTYKSIGVAKWAPKKAGLTLGMIYANIDGAGECRVRLIRGDLGGSGEDPTAYQTFYVQAGDNYLLTHVWFESGEAKRPLWWEITSMDGTTHTITTRYAKFVTIPWDVTVLLGRATTALNTVGHPIQAFKAKFIPTPEPEPDPDEWDTVPNEWDEGPETP